MSRSKRPALKRRLTELAVRNLAPKGDAYLVWDSHQRGLAIRVRPTGHKAWKVIYSRHGRPRWLNLGSSDVVPLADARTMAAEALLAVAKGRDPAAEKKAERGAGTFADLHARYLEEHAKRVNRSWRQADALIRRYVLPRWAKLQAVTITRTDVKQMIARIGAPITANQTLAAVSAVFTWGVKEEIVGGNPCKLVARNPTKSCERVLADSEIAPLWTALDKIGPPRAAALRMLLLVGHRPGEVAHMRREHIKDGWWELPGAPISEIWPGTKNGKSHRVWLPTAARTIIKDMPRDDELSGFVFAAPRGGPVKGLHLAAREACANIGIEPVRPHDLRRTHGTTITRLKFGRDAMNRIQNHIEGGIADVYDQYEYDEENRQIMKSIGNHPVLGLQIRSSWLGAVSVMLGGR
jgi:integrase